MLTRTKILLASGLAVASLIPGIASAHTDLSIGVNLGGYAPIYSAPAPVYVEAAPTVVYEPAPPIVYEPAPTVVYGQTVVWGQPYWDGHRWCRDGERRWR